MGEDLGRVYTALSTELAWAHVKWQLYRQLYAEPGRVDVLNRTAGHFFGTLQRALFDDIVLHLSRMTDSPSTGRGKNRRPNLTIRRLPWLVPAVLKADVHALVAAAVNACAPFWPWRHRRLAHTDLAHAITGDPLPGLSRAQIESALAALVGVLNRLDSHYRQSTTMYADTVAPAGDAESLVFYLEKGLRAVEEERRRWRRSRLDNPKEDDTTDDDGPPGDDGSTG
jgi:hypothetical protein